MPQPQPDWPKTLDEFRARHEQQAGALPRGPEQRHYLVIHQDARRVVHHQRRDELGGQFLTTIVAGDMLRLEGPGIDLPLARLYDGVPVA